MSFLEKIGLKAKGLRKPRYQAYGKITFEEVDEVSNFKAPNLTESMLYDTKRAKKGKSVRAYKATTRDYDGNTEVHTSAWEDQDVTREWGFYHISAIQILAKWLGNTGLDIPLTVVLRDKRILDTERQIMGIWSTNLYTGAVYTEMFLNLLISAGDRHKLSCCVIDAKAQVNMTEESKGLSLSINTHFAWLERPYPYTSRDYMFRAEKESDGKSIYIKPSTVDARTIPQPIEVSKSEIIRDFNFQREEPPLNAQEAATTRGAYTVKNNKLYVRFE
ncbi:uncharacterized protein LOC115726776 [Rhodamnia argentea]|uniref:Uncharacterized protein LOC115726776 n=1 Tax=Rhodamnia argentea TaxID=178133 RepID=A0A8B8MQ13_9MYRT|nr:uncharacterized protein LOC115726776 [Rhodamnia argentea]XP_048139132.1 uncharacterized protein LOC115726776 [Rhodamnia argentea]